MKEKKVLASFLFLTIAFGIYMLKSGYYFHSHSYYIIPFVPVMALIIGNFLSQIQNQKWAVIILFVGVGESLANQQHDFRINDSEKYKLSLESILDQAVPKNALICINGEGNPQELYLGHRKGWVGGNEQILDPEFLISIHEHGAQYMVLNLHTFSQKIDLLPIHSTEHYAVFELVSFTSNLSNLD
jgi:hypothetical protein